MSNSKVLRPSIGVGVLVWRGRQLLLGQRVLEQGRTCWQFPGGHLESEESVIECAVREVLEETGISITAARHLDYTGRAFNAGSRSYLTLFVSCEYASGEATVLEPDKCRHWQWFDYPELPSPLFAPIEILLSQHEDLYSLHQSVRP